jgi:hypothetical protein
LLGKYTLNHVAHALQKTSFSIFKPCSSNHGYNQLILGCPLKHSTRNRVSQ